MKRLSLSPGGPLSALAGPNALLGFDFDGVLAPIAAMPSEVHVPARTRALLRELSGVASCAVVSGRSLPDLRRMLTGIPFTALVGNHGAERSGKAVSRALLHRVRVWQSQLEPLANDGIEIEDKRVSLSVHFRRSRRPAAALRTILAVAERLDGARLVLGKRVVNVVGARASNKGDAFLALCRERGVRASLFVGDDRTDEDVFRLRLPGLVSVRVGRSKMSAARFYLPRQRDIDSLIEALRLVSTARA